MCDHQNTREVGDMPVANPETMEYEGHFDVVMCVECNEILTRTPVGVPPEVLF